MSAEDDRLERLAEYVDEFVAARQMDEAPDVETYRAKLGEQFEDFQAMVTAELAMQAFMEPPDSVRLPRELGAYTLTRELGRGGMGIVYEAVQRATQRTVAVKVLRLGFAGRADARARFRREAQALARVRHPNIVEFLEANEEDEQPYYVMSRVEGRSLAARPLDGTAPSFADLCRGLAGVADALHTMHEAGLLHRDVKPANIMQALDGTMVLADFGLARGDDFLTLTASGDVLGTPLYMSPEQIVGSRDRIDARSDVYSLGATFYFVLVGRPPFESERLPDLSRAILIDRPSSPRGHRPEVPQACEWIALKCLEKRREDRYQTAAELRDDLIAFAEGKRVSGRPVAALRRGARAIGRRPLLAAGGLGALLLGGYFSFRTRPALLSVDMSVSADVLVGGQLRGSTPLHDCELEPGKAQTIVVEPRDKRFWSWHRTLVPEEGTRYHFEAPVEARDVGDWSSVRVTADALGIPFEQPRPPVRRRSSKTPWLQALFPRGRVRPRDLADRGIRIDTSVPLEAGARIVFRRAGEELMIAEGWVPAGETNYVAIPQAVLAALHPADRVTWGVEQDGRDAVTTAFEVVSDDLVDKRLLRLDQQAALFQGSDGSVLLRRILRARLLLQEGLPLAAYFETREQAERGRANLLLLALEKEALEAIFPHEKERSQTEPWRRLVHEISDDARWSSEEVAKVFGAPGGR